MLTSTSKRSRDPLEAARKVVRHFEDQVRHPLQALFSLCRRGKECAKPADRSESPQTRSSLRVANDRSGLPRSSVPGHCAI
jgi:hypothetical protein